MGIDLCMCTVYVYHAYPLNLFRKEALLIWKQRLGSSATYNELIGVFKRAGYKHYAEKVRKLVHDSNTDDSSSSEESFPLPQPPTYPPLNSPSLNEVLSPNSELCLLIDPASAELFPEGKSSVTIFMK